MPTKNELDLWFIDCKWKLNKFALQFLIPAIMKRDLKSLKLLLPTLAKGLWEEWKVRIRVFIRKNFWSWI